MAFDNPSISRNNVIFSIALLLLHIAVPLVYAFLVPHTTSYINISSIVFAIFLGFLAIAGFGLVFSFFKRLLWTSLGFSFLITALCLEFYPFVNALWTKVGIQNITLSPNTFDDQQFHIYLSNFQIPTGGNSSNTITSCFKCAISIIVAFSCVVGRVGALECLIITIFGIFGYEVNRQVISNLAIDSFGSFAIFTFGGFMGLALGFILRIRESGSDQSATHRHKKYEADVSSISRSIMGSLIVFLLMPLLAVDLDAYHGINQFNVYTGPLYVILAMGAAIMGGLVVSLLINGYAIVRDLIYAPIAGAIIVGSASFWITNPSYAMAGGFVGGAIMATIQNIFEKNYGRDNNIISSISWSLFGIQGILGGALAAGFRQKINKDSEGITFNSITLDFNPGYEMLIAVISAGIGLGVGILAGLLSSCVNNQHADDHFDDRTYWFNSSGINYGSDERIAPPRSGGLFYDDDGFVPYEAEGGPKDQFAYL